MLKVRQLGLGEISPIVQYLLELPGKFGNRAWTGPGREEIPNWMHHVPSSKIYHIPHNIPQNYVS